jgi:hypothetical protein|tara:strand:- start:172 stop:1044 length:873 start_codon:yes stop_codon:yes gene_type:complete
MPITVIISHFIPDGNQKPSFQMLKEIIESVRNQNGNIEVEIIICDDGSYCNKSVFPDNGISVATKTELEDRPDFSDLDFDVYLYHHTEGYQRAKLWNKATKISHNYNLVFLDDDSPFLQKESLRRYEHYFSHYSYIKGRIISSQGVPHLFSDTRVQGTNFGLRKSLYEAVGGMPDYISEDSFGDDDDFTYRVYKYILNNNDGHKACYAGDICVKNSSTGRWYSGRKDKDERGKVFSMRFREEHGIDDSYNLGSRNKKLWMEFPSWRARLMEHYYKFIYFGKMRLGWKDIF